MAQEVVIDLFSWFPPFIENHVPLSVFIGLIPRSKSYIGNNQSQVLGVYGLVPSHLPSGGDSGPWRSISCRTSVEKGTATGGAPSVSCPFSLTGLAESSTGLVDG